MADLARTEAKGLLDVRAGDDGGGVMADTLYRGDCREILPTLPAESVQLVVTSPPYNVGWRYGDDGTADRLPLQEYQAMLADVLAALFRVLRPGGVLALNLPPSIRTPEHRAFPLASWATWHLFEVGWLLAEPLAWVKASRDGRPLASGTAFGGPRVPYLRPCHEMVIIAHKAAYRITSKGGRDWPASPGYIEWLKDVWVLPPGRARRGHALAFPDELVRRLLQLYSAPSDVVLDPFAGTGTVGRLARDLGRTAWLIEREPAYCPQLEAAASTYDVVAAASP